MDPGIFISALLIVVGIPAYTVMRLARLRASRSEAPSAEISARLESLENEVQDLQHALSETQERVDFTERLLTKARDERQIGS